MTNYIAHADAARTFADKKGAMKAARRDVTKHYDAHADADLLITDIEAQPVGDRWGVVIHTDMTPDEAHVSVQAELTGYMIAPSEDVRPAPEPTPAPKAKAKPAGGKRVTGNITIEARAPLQACREGTKQQALVDALANPAGATLTQLQKLCVKRDGVTLWDMGSVRSALYYDLRDKGYGIRTDMTGEEPVHFLVLPEGYDEPAAAKSPKAAKTPE